MGFPPPSTKQAQVIWFALTALAVALTLAIIGGVLWGLGQVLVALSPVLWPIAVAGIIAFILDPVVDWLGERGVPRLRAILLVFGVAMFVVFWVFWSFVPRLVVETSDLARKIKNEYAVSAGQRIQGWIARPPASLSHFLPAHWLAGAATTNRTAESTNSGVPDSAGAAQSTGETASTNQNALPGGRTEAGSTNGVVAGGQGSATASGWWARALDPSALRTAGDWLGTILGDLGRWLLGQIGRVASWFGILAGIALIPIYAFYFLLEKRKIQERWTQYLPVSDSRFKDELVWLLENINDALIVFFRGQVLVAICDGVLYTIGFLVIGLPYALLLGLLATVLTIVPFLGAIVTCTSALLIAIVQYGDWQHPALVLVIFMLVQGIEGWVIQPKIIGDRVGLHPVTIIVALLVGTTLMGGVLGGLLAIPATAVLRALMFRYVWRSDRSAGAAGAAAS
ncbi:MAG: AI-2E family transporter [Verrucomicrobiales bacterium]|nr:AI-2E family transporter [Verrucomicrobiales bacterium]